MSIAVNLPLPESAATDFGDDEAAMVRYRDEGTRRALALGNRGPVRLDPRGRLTEDILAAYRALGFYVFTDVVDARERAELERDVAEILERAPVSPEASVDRHGRPALGAGNQGRSYRLVRPLSDPLGGTDINHGRHPVKMAEPVAPEGAPPWLVQILLGPLQHSEACLRFYGHPTLLAIAASLNGEDFTPFNEVVWVKHPRLGSSVAWHQDGWTHWDAPDLDWGTHGFNAMLQLYGCDAANGLWIVPGTHRQGKVDIRALRDAAGSDRLAGAVPLVCDPGDLAVVSRQAVHGSFANTSDRVRVSIHAGFHRRVSVLNVRSGGVHNPVSFYDEAYIRRRSRVIMYGIDARRTHRPGETAFHYAPLAGEADALRWTDAARADLVDYNLQDLGI